MALELDDGMPFRAIVAEAGKAVTHAVLQKQNGCVAEALRGLRMSKGTWYRIRRKE